MISNPGFCVWERKRFVKNKKIKEKTPWSNANNNCSLCWPRHVTECCDREFIGFIQCHRHSCSVVEVSTALQHPQDTRAFDYIKCVEKIPSQASGKNKPNTHVVTEGVFFVCLFFTGDGRLVQCHQSGQVPLPTGGLPWSKWWGGEGNSFHHTALLSRQEIICLLMCDKHYS